MLVEKKTKTLFTDASNLTTLNTLYKKDQVDFKSQNINLNIISRKGLKNN